eukprot:78314-Rhodomonas_salina.1
MSEGSNGMTENEESGIEEESSSSSNEDLANLEEESLSGEEMEFGDQEENEDVVEEEESDDDEAGGMQPFTLAPRLFTRTERLSASSNLGRVVDMIRRSRRIL